MPPRTTPSTLVLRVKSHRTTVFATVPSNATIATLKNLVQNALNAHAQAEAERGLPLPVESIDDFLLSLRRTDSNKRPIFVDIAEDNASTSLLDLQVKNWDAVYIRWRGEDGVYAPVKVTLPRLEAPSDEDEPNGEEEGEEEEKEEGEEEKEEKEEAPAPKKNKGKGKS